MNDFDHLERMYAPLLAYRMRLRNIAERVGQLHLMVPKATALRVTIRELSGVATSV